MINSCIVVRKPLETDWQELLTLHQASQEFHFPWVFPALTEDGCKAYIRRCQNEDFEGLLICHAETSRIIGVANLSQIFYKSFQNAYLGYYGSVEYAGQGLMTEGLRLVVNHAFYILGLHRLEANIQPDNQRSIALIRRLGFTQEGFSRRYLYINGAWRDHERWAVTVENWI
ncbi:MAG: GNAT family protein [Oculatellaceae cyanobacterium bins.114]|nr:GNAT family protein [Oculatellaceae cyanobacterium bins.114]